MQLSINVFLPGQCSGCQPVSRIGYSLEYIDEYDDDFDDYSYSEARVARGERDYFTDNPSDDYNSYYAQVADNAMMGDSGAMDEMRAGSLEIGRAFPSANADGRLFRTSLTLILLARLQLAAVDAFGGAP